MKRTFLRVVSMCLAVIMLVGTANLSVFASQIDTGNNAQTPQATVRASVARSGSAPVKTDGQIVAEMYSEKLSQTEKDILASPALKGDGYIIEEPDASLVSVDADNHKVYAENKPVMLVSGTEATNMLWVPVSIQVYEGEIPVGDPIPYVSGGTSFNPEGRNNYSVQVTYQLQVTMDVAQQQELLDAPVMLSNAVKDLFIIAGQVSNLNIVAANLDKLQPLSDGIDVAGLFTLIFPDAANDGYKALCADAKDANKQFDLCYEFDANNNNAYSGDELQYLMARGVELSELASDMVANITPILTSLTGINSTLQLIVTNNPQSEYADEYSATTAAVSAIESICKAFNALSGDYAKLGKEESPLKLDAVATDLTALDVLIEASVNNPAVGEEGHDANKVINAHTADLNRAVSLAEKIIVGTVNQKIVTINVSAFVYELVNGANVLVEKSGQTTQRTMNTDALAAEVEAEIDALKADLLDASIANEWVTCAEKYALDKYNTYYDVSFEGIPDMLEEDVTVTIKLTPKQMLSVEYVYDPSANTTVGYGYTIILPTYFEENASSSKSYLYNIDGVEYDEGTEYRVYEDIVIDRAEGMPLCDPITIPAFIAQSVNPNSTGNWLTAKDIAILSAGGLKNSGVAQYGVPTDEDVVLELSKNALAVEPTYIVTANAPTTKVNINGVFKDATWMPYQVIYVDGTEKTADFNGATTVQFVCENDISGVDVVYRLQVGDSILSADTAAEYINLIAVLASEAAAQSSKLNSIKSQLEDKKDKLGYISMIGGILGQYENDPNVSDMNKNLTSTNYEKLTEECYDLQGNLVVLKTFSDYAGAKEDMLARYYSGVNAVTLRNQIYTFRTNFINFLDDQVFLDWLAVKMPDLAGQISELTDKSEGSLYDKISDFDILPVNANIDTEAANKELSALAKALLSAGSVTSAAPAFDTLVYESDKFSVSRSGFQTVTVKVNAAGQTFTFKKDYDEAIHFDDVLIQQFKDAVTAAMADAVAHLGDSAKHYNPPAYESILPQVNETPEVYVARVGKTVTLEYTRKEYSIVGSTTIPVEFDDTSLTLPTPDSAAVAYIYTITLANGQKKEITVESFNGLFGWDALGFDFDDLFGDSQTATITVREVDIAERDFLAFVELLNDAFKAANADVAIIPTEDALAPGYDYGLILRMGAGATSMDINSMKDKLLAALQSYGAIMIEDKVFFNGSTISVQSIINMIANGGMSMDKIYGMIDDNGAIANDSQLLTLTPMSGSLTNVGGLVMSNSMVLKESVQATVGINVALYTTLSGSSSQLLGVKNAIGTIKNYINVSTEDGVYNLHLNMPDKLYPYYMSAMLLLDQTQFEDIQGGINVEDTMNYYKGMIRDLTGDKNFGVETLENTIAEFGRTVDLSAYASTFDTVRRLVNYILVETEKENGQIALEPIESDNEHYMAVLTCAAAPLLDRLPEKLDLVKMLIAENTPDGELTLTYNITVEDRKVDYDAMIFDNSEAGLGKFYYAKASEFASRLEKLGNNSVVILISDAKLSKDVVIPNNVFINLNGKKLEGNLSTTARVTISDSTLHTNEPGVGEVNGTLSGNFIITGGMYLNGEERMDVSAMLKDGYVQNADGYVSNIFYTIEEDTEGNISINIPANILSTRTIPEIKALAVDIAMDIAFNVYNAASLNVDGLDIYSFATDDLISLATMSGKEIAQELIDKVNVANVKSLAQSIYYELTNFSDVAAKINSENGVIVDYELSTKGWGFQFSVSEENTIVVDLVPDKQVDRTFSIAVVDNTDDSVDDKALLADLFAEIGKSLKYDPTINHLSIAYNGGLDVDFDGELTVDINLSHNNNYAALLVAAVASANNDANLKSILKTYLDETTKTETSTTALNTALENITLAQFVKGLQHLKAVGCDEMLASIDTTNTADLKKLEAIYDDLVYIAGVVLTRLDITGGAQKLAGHKVAGTFSTYSYGPKTITFDKRGVEVSMTLALTMTMMKEGVAEEEEIIPQIEVAVGSDKDEYTVGETITWTVTVTNTGSYTTYLNSYSDTFSGVNGTLNNIAVEPGDTATFTYTSVAAGEGMIPNTVTVTHAPEEGVVTRAFTAKGTKWVKVNAAVIPGPSGGGGSTPSKPVVKDPKLNADASSDKLLGTAVATVGSDKYLQLDLHVDGITVEELLESLHISATGSRVEIEASVTNSKTVDGKEIVVTGSVLTITAKNNRGTTSKEYVIVIDGDVNCDGYVNTADAVYLAWHYCDIATIEGTAAMMAATGNSKDTDVHADDAMRIVFKYLHWKAGDDRYVSQIGS